MSVVTFAGFIGLYTLAASFIVMSTLSSIRITVLLLTGLLGAASSAQSQIWELHPQPMYAAEGTHSWLHPIDSDRFVMFNPVFGYFPSYTVLGTTTDRGVTWYKSSTLTGRFAPLSKYLVHYDPYDGFFQRDGTGYLFGSREESLTSQRGWGAHTGNMGATWDTIWNEGADQILGLIAASKRYLLISKDNRSTPGNGCEILRLEVGKRVLTQVLDAAGLPFNGKKILSSAFNDRGDIALTWLEDTGSAPKLLRSLDSGLTWSVLGAAPFSGTVEKLASSGRFWYMQSGRSLYRSIDTGRSWQSVLKNENFASFEVNGPSGLIVLNPADYALFSQDSGQTWHSESFDNSTDKYLIVQSTDPAHFVVSGGDPGFYTHDVTRAFSGAAVLHLRDRTFDMGITTYLDTARSSLALYNIGEDTLRVDSVSNRKGKALVTPTRFRIGPRDSISVTVNWFTDSFDRMSDTLILYTNTSRRTESVRVVDWARYARLSATTETPLFAPLGDQSTVRVTLQNTGNDTLRISRIDTLGEVSSYDLPRQIGPRSSASGVIGLAGRTPGIKSASIILGSNSASSSVDTMSYMWIVPPENLRNTWEYRTADSISVASTAHVCGSEDLLFSSDATSPSNVARIERISPTGKLIWVDTALNRTTSAMEVSPNGSVYWLNDTTRHSRLVKLSVDGSRVWEYEQTGESFGKQIAIASNGNVAVNLESYAYSSGNGYPDIIHSDEGTGHVIELSSEGRVRKEVTIIGNSNYTLQTLRYYVIGKGKDEALAIAYNDTNLIVSTQLDSTHHYSTNFSDPPPTPTYHYQLANLGDRAWTAIVSRPLTAILPSENSSYFVQSGAFWYLCDTTGALKQAEAATAGLLTANGDLITVSDTTISRTTASLDHLWQLETRFGSGAARLCKDRFGDLFFAVQDNATILVGKVSNTGDLRSLVRYAPTGSAARLAALAVDSSGNLYLSATRFDSTSRRSQVVIVRYLQDPRGEVRTVITGQAGRLTLWPNPTSQDVHVAASFAISSIDLYDPLGRVVIHANGAETLDLQHLTPAVYVVAAHGVRGESSVARLVIQ